MQHTTQHNTNALFTDTLKTAALADYLEIDMDDIFQSDYDPMEFEADGENYLVLTNEEADDRTGDYIKESLWAFNAGFIIDHSELPCDAIDLITAYQDDSCEGANDTIAALITDIDEFIEDAIGADGRGCFLNGYDGDEHESQGFYIYQV